MALQHLKNLGCFTFFFHSVLSIAFILGLITVYPECFWWQILSLECNIWFIPYKQVMSVSFQIRVYFPVIIFPSNSVLHNRCSKNSIIALPYIQRRGTSCRIVKGVETKLQTEKQNGLIDWNWRRCCSHAGYARTSRKIAKGQKKSLLYTDKTLVHTDYTMKMCCRMWRWTGYIVQRSRCAYWWGIRKRSSFKRYN
jgi:hypothetical protein